MDHVPSPLARQQRPPPNKFLWSGSQGGEGALHSGPGFGAPAPRNQPFNKRLILFLVGLTIVPTALIGGSRNLRAQLATPTLTHTTLTDFEAGQALRAQVIDVAGGEVQLVPIGVTSPWQQAEDLPAPRNQIAAVATDRWLYVFGGMSADGISPTSTVYTTTVDADTGTLDAWQALPMPMPANLAGHLALLDPAGPHVYVLGGFTRQGFDFPSQDLIYRGALQPDGSIGAWVTDTVRLPYAAHYAMGAVHNQHLYFLGGQTVITGSAQFHDEVYRAPIGVDGSLGAFQTEPSLPVSLSYAMTVLYRRSGTEATLFVLGGNRAAGEGNANVYYADISQDGTLTPWQVAPVSLPEPFLGAAAILVNDQILLVGGVGPTQTSGQRAKVISLPLDPDAPGYLYDWQDELPAWRNTFELPAPRYAHSAVWVSDHVFVIGGADTHALPQNTVYTAPTRGLASQYVPQATFTHTLPLPAGSFPQHLVLETAVTDTSAVTMAFAYQSDPAQSWVSTDLLGYPLVAADQPVDVLTSTARVTYTLPALVAQQFAYQVALSTTISSTTPLLHSVELYYIPEGSGQVLFLPFVGSD